MSSISPQAVVERASAEISKRINGLGLRTKHHHSNNATSAAAAACATSTTTTTTTTTSSTVPAANCTTATTAGNGNATITTTTNCSKSTSVMERVTHVLCGGNFNQTANSNNTIAAKNSLNNINVVVMADKQTRNTPTPPIPTSPSNIVSVGSNSNYQQQLQTQIAGSTLVQSNLAPTPTALGLTSIGAPPTPTVTSIAKQMNIPLPGGLGSNMTSTSLKSNATISSRKSIIAHHPYAAPGAQCVSPSTVAVAATISSQSAQQQKQQQQQHLNVAQTQAIKVYNQGSTVKTIAALMLEERFLNNFFLYFNANERRILAQVCIKWRDILYRIPRFWFGLVPVLPCRELRQLSSNERMKIYNSIIRRGFRALTLVGTSDEDALDIVHTFPLATKHVHSLTLRCSSISDRGLEALLDHLQSLFELELSGCNEVTEAGLWACLTPRIVSLSLNDCINIADEAIGAVAQLLPSLYEFSLQAYHVTDAALGYFSPKQSHSLSILRLQSCWELTNHGIVNIVHSLPHLTVLSLSGCSKLTDDGVELIAENLQKLRALDLSWCPRVTDASLEYIACDLNHLEELTLDRCIHITDIGVGYISTMLTLTTLFLRWCSQVRDFGLQHLCSMRNLQVLSLAGCPLLTSSGLSSLIQLRHLQELELTNCPGASHELFEYLKEHLPHCLIIE